MSSRAERIAVFLDFKSFNQLDMLSDLMEKLRGMGRIIRATLFIGQDEISSARDYLPEIAKLGLEPVVTVFSKGVKATLDVVESCYREDLSVLVLGWSDDSLLPPLLEVRERKKIWMITREGEPLEDIRKIADKVIEFEIR